MPAGKEKAVGWKFLDGWVFCKHCGAAWESSRNQATKHVDWQFTTQQARDKLKWLYPKL